MSVYDHEEFPKYAKGMTPAEVAFDVDYDPDMHRMDFVGLATRSSRVVGIDYGNIDVEAIFGQARTRETGMDRKSVIEYSIAQLQKELAELSQFGDDDYDDGTILRISMRYPNRPTIYYKYAAIKIGPMNVWFTTTTRASSNNMFTWAELCQWMRPHVVKVEVVTEMETLFDKETIEGKIIEAPEDTTTGLDVQ